MAPEGKVYLIYCEEGSGRSRAEVWFARIRAAESASQPAASTSRGASGSEAHCRRDALVQHQPPAAIPAGSRRWGSLQRRAAPLPGGAVPGGTSSSRSGFGVGGFFDAAR